MTAVRTALIVTALQVEYLAVRSHLNDFKEVVHEEGTVYEIGTFATDAATWSVAILEAGMGNVPAGVETERAIATFRPELAVFVGIAGGLKDVDIGDIVAATSVYGYESGKVADRFLPRGDIGQSSYPLVNRAKAEARKNSWLALIKSPPTKQPRAFVGKIAAGEKVIAEAKSETRLMLAQHYSDALAVEMEGRGFLAATYANHSVQGIVIRGISDLLDNKAASDAQGSQALAASHASAFAFNLLATFTAPASGDDETSSRIDRAAVLADFYRTWISERTATFYVPALGVDLPSTDAFATLVVRTDEDDDREDDEDDEPRPHFNPSFDEELSRYHAPVARSRRKELHATDLIVRRRLITIVGGPGAGKTTLAKLLAYNATRNGEIALLVPLKRLLPRQANESFDVALRRVATIETGISGVESLSPDLVICDGLDECEPSRAEIARELAGWAKDHPSTRVVVATRRLGHHTSLLPGFLETDLPHLDWQEGHDLAKLLVETAVRKDSQLVVVWTRVRAVLSDEGVIRGLAHRNPLLLSFVVRLVLDDVPVASNRAELYAQIIEVIRTSAPAGRVSVAVEAASANRVAETLAFAVIDNPRQSSLQLIQTVASALSGAQAPDAAEDRVERAIRFWEERWLIERILFGSIESFTFIHHSFAEYLASARIAAMTSENLLLWIRSAHRESKWHEPILFAANRGPVERYARVLLDSVDCTDPVETAPLLAAEIVVDAGGAPLGVMGDLVAVLSLRMESDIRSVALESAVALAKLTPFAPLSVAQEVAPLRDHSQLWTRIAAIGIGAIAGDARITVQHAKAFFDAFHSPPPRRENGMLAISFGDLPRTPDLWRSAVAPLSTILLKSENSKATRAYLTERFFEDPSDDSLRDVEKAIEPFGDTTWFTQRLEEWNDQWRRVSTWSTNPHFEKNLLLWFLNVLEPHASSSALAASGSYPLIARLYSALQLMQYPVGELSNYPKTPITPAVREVFKGLLSVIAVDPEQLADELTRAVAYLQSDEHLFFMELADDVEPPVGWKHAPQVAIDGELLIEALESRRPAIMRASALLLAYVAWSAARLPALRELLRTGSRSTMGAAAWVLVKAAPLAESFEALTSRLREPSTGGCGDVYEFLAELHARADAPLRDRIVDILFSGLDDEHSYAARGAARAIGSLRLSSEPVRDAQLTSAFAAWQSREIRCLECDRVTTKTFCERCHYSLKTPLAPILRELGRRGIEPPLAELVSYFPSKWSDLAKAAKAVARERLIADAGKVRDVVGALLEGETSLAPLLPVILQLNSKLLVPAKSMLLQIADRGDHLAEFTASLESGWLSRTDIERIARKALLASDSLAEKALKVLRNLAVVQL